MLRTPRNANISTAVPGMLAAKDKDVETKGASERQSITPLLAAETRLLTNTLSVHSIGPFLLMSDRQRAAAI